MRARQSHVWHDKRQAIAANAQWFEPVSAPTWGRKKAEDAAGMALFETHEPEFLARSITWIERARKFRLVALAITERLGRG